MRRLLLTTLLLFIFSSDAATQSKHGFVIPRTDIINITDNATQKRYELYVKLPSNYDAGDKHYPVVYYTDAYWHIEILSALSEFLFEDVILIGIAWQTNSDPQLVEEVGPYVSRFSDYSYAPSINEEHQHKYRFGQAAQHLAFIRKDVIPFVDTRYRTDPSKRSYFGYSLGGAFGAYTVMSQPDTFHYYVLGSPSVWQDITQYTTPKPEGIASRAKVFISHGSTENKLQTKVEAFIQILEKQLVAPESVHYQVMNGDHTTAFPETAVEAVKWLSSLQTEPVEESAQD